MGMVASFDRAKKRPPSGALPASQAVACCTVRCPRKGILPLERCKSRQLRHPLDAPRAAAVRTVGTVGAVAIGAVAPGAIARHALVRCARALARAIVAA